MRIAYVTTNDPNDLVSFSGMTAAIPRALTAAGADIVNVGPLPIRWRKLFRAKQLAYKAIRQKHQYEREPIVAQEYARIASERLRDLDVDVILSDSSIPVAYLEVDRPVAFWTDATFGALVGYYPEFSTLSAETIRNGESLERRALQNCTRAIYSSAWAAASALERYGADPGKVAVIPFGANITEVPDSALVRERRAAIDRSRCELLFIGLDWHRKGGDTAVAAAKALNDRGIPTRLHVVGCTPPGPTPDFVVLHGRISKASAAGRAQLSALFLQSHFLILPTRAECVANVFAESFCHGLPVIAPDTGGVSEAVRADQTGILLSPAASGAEYAEHLAEYLGSADAFTRLSRNARELFESTLNWKSAAHSLLDALSTISEVAGGAPHPQRDNRATRADVFDQEEA